MVFKTAKKKPKALIFDIDGVVCDSSERFKRIDLEAFKNKDKNAFIKSLKEYNKDCVGDIIIDKGLDLLYMLESNYKPYRVFFVTARGSYGYDPTLDWLKDENIWDDNYELIMQPEDFDDWEFTTQKDHAEFKKNVAKEKLFPAIHFFDIMVHHQHYPICIFRSRWR